MPDLLALEWDAQEVSAVAAQVARKSVQVKQFFVVAWPREIDAVGNPRQAGEWLKQELARQGIDAKEALVALPRELVSVKPLELPAVPDDELPDVVKLQAATKSALPLEQLKIDFIPASQNDGAQTRKVWLASLPRKAFDRMKHLAESAGLEVAGAGMTPVATATVVALASQKRADSHNGTSLLISQRGKRVEISILGDQRVLFSHAAMLHGETLQEQNQAILVDLNRCLVAADSEGIHSQKFAQVWLLGGDSQNVDLVESLRRRFGCSVVTSLDPLTETGVSGGRGDALKDRWPLAAPAGMLLSRAGLGFEGVDFINPRKPPEKRDQRKLRAALIAAGILLLLGGAFLNRQMALGDLKAKVASLNKRKAELDERIDNGKAELEAAQTVEQWLGLKVDWISQFDELKQSFAAANGIYLSDFRVTPSSVKGEVAGVKATGYARKEDDVRALYRRLYELNYQANPYSISKSDSNGDYPIQFELSVQLLKGRKALPPPKPEKIETKENEMSDDAVASEDEANTEGT
jgi:hypothetical protein